ncbi:unnamed protein product [Caenorhabditis angaria]|uniref:Uncharacterized protein n=1 Tax=Caenorhabditis angaria TaxID=860376 RepID=A0A9P1IY05_9PELO|nr:unnamed protein product [Caenorhabditis angaria]
MSNNPEQNQPEQNEDGRNIQNIENAMRQLLTRNDEMQLEQQDLVQPIIDIGQHFQFMWNFMIDPNAGNGMSQEERFLFLQQFNNYTLQLLQYHATRYFMNQRYQQEQQQWHQQLQAFQNLQQENPELVEDVEVEVEVEVEVDEDDQ